MPSLITVAEVARRLGVSKATAYRIVPELMRVRVRGQRRTKAPKQKDKREEVTTPVPYLCSFEAGSVGAMFFSSIPPCVSV